MSRVIKLLYVIVVTRLFQCLVAFISSGILLDFRIMVWMKILGMETYCCYKKWRTVSVFSRPLDVRAQL